MRLCNAELTPSIEGRAAMSVVVPFLLREGITSVIKEAQAQCVVYLAEIAEVCGWSPLPSFY